MDTKYLTDKPKENHARGIRALDLCSNILRDLLTSKVPPVDLLSTVQAKPTFYDGLRPQEKIEIKASTENKTYQNMDFSFLYKLLRNNGLVAAPKVGWGRKPAVIDVEVGDDIERIRFIRNDIQGHPTYAEISDADLSSILTTISEVCSRMESGLGIPYVNSLNTIKTCTMDAKVEQIKRFADSEMKKYGKNVHLRNERVIKGGHNCLKNSRSLVMSGIMGSGKTTTCRQLVHDLIQSEPDREPYFLQSPSEFPHIAGKDKKQVIILDDPFGRSNLDRQLLKDWELYFERIETLTSDMNYILIITCRTRILKEAKPVLSKYKLFHSERTMDISVDPWLLTQHEKEQMVKHYCEQFDVCISYATSVNNMAKTIKPQVIWEISRSCPRLGFPQSCHLFFNDQKFFSQGSTFFIKANEELKEEIDSLRHVFPIQYIILVYILLHPNMEIDICNVDDILLRSITECLQFEKPEKYRIYDIVKYVMCGKYLEKHHDTNCFVLQHQSIFESILISFCTFFPKHVIQTAPFNTTEDFLRPSTYVPGPSEVCVRVDRNSDECLAKQFAEFLLKNENGYLVFYTLTRYDVIFLKSIQNFTVLEMSTSQNMFPARQNTTERNQELVGILLMALSVDGDHAEHLFELMHTVYNDFDIRVNMDTCDWMSKLEANNLENMKLRYFMKVVDTCDGSKFSYLIQDKRFTELLFLDICIEGSNIHIFDENSTCKRTTVLKHIILHTPQMITKHVLKIAFSCLDYESVKLMLALKEVTFDHMDPEELSWGDVMMRDKSDVVDAVLQYAPNFISAYTLQQAYKYNAYKSIRAIVSNQAVSPISNESQIDLNWRGVMENDKIDIVREMVKHIPNFISSSGLLLAFKYGAFKSIKEILCGTKHLEHKVDPRSVEWSRILQDDAVDVVKVVTKEGPWLFTTDAVHKLIQSNASECIKYLLIEMPTVFQGVDPNELNWQNILDLEKTHLIEDILKHTPYLITNKALLQSFKVGAFQAIKLIIEHANLIDINNIDVSSIVWRNVMYFDNSVVIKTILRHAPQLITKDSLIMAFHYSACKTIVLILTHIRGFEIDSTEIQWNKINENHMNHVIEVVLDNAPHLITKDAALKVFEYGNSESFLKIISKKTVLFRELNSSDISWDNVFEHDRIDIVEAVLKYAPQLITKETLLTAFGHGVGKSLKTILIQKGVLLLEMEPNSIPCKSIIETDYLIKSVLKCAPQLVTKEVLLTAFRYSGEKILKLILTYKYTFLSEIQPHEINLERTVQQDMIEVIETVLEYSPQLITKDTLLIAFEYGSRKSLEAILTYKYSLLSEIAPQDIQWNYIVLQDMSKVIETVLKHSPHLITMNAIMIAIEFGSLKSLKKILTYKFSLVTDIEPAEIQWKNILPHDMSEVINIVLKYSPQLITRDAILTALAYGSQKSLKVILTNKPLLLCEIEPQEIQWNKIMQQNVCEVIETVLIHRPQLITKDALLIAFRCGGHKLIKIILTNKPSLLCEIEPQEIQWNNIMQQNVSGVIEIVLIHSPQLITKDTLLTAFRCGGCNSLEIILIYKLSLLNDIETQEIQWNHIMEHDKSELIKSVLKYSPELITKSTLLTAFQYSSYKSLKAILTYKSSLLGDIEPQEIAWTSICYQDLNEVITTVLKISPRLITKDTVLLMFQFGSCKSLDAILSYESSIVSVEQLQDINWKSIFYQNFNEVIEIVLKHSPQLITKHNLMTAFQYRCHKSCETILTLKSSILNEIEPQEIPWRFIFDFDMDEVIKIILKHSPHLITKDNLMTAFKYSRCKSLKTILFFKSFLLSEIEPQDIQWNNILQHDMYEVMRTFLKLSPQLIRKRCLLTAFLCGSCKSINTIVTYNSSLLNEINPQEIRWEHILRHDIWQIIEIVLNHSPRLITKGTLLTVFEYSSRKSLKTIITYNSQLLSEIKSHEILRNQNLCHGMSEVIDIVQEHHSEVITKDFLLAAFEFCNLKLLEATLIYKSSVVSEIDPKEIQWINFLHCDQSEAFRIVLKYSTKLITKDTLLTAIEHCSRKSLKIILTYNFSFLNEIEAGEIQWSHVLYHDMIEVIETVLNHLPQLMTKDTLLTALKHGSPKSLKVILTYKRSLLCEIEPQEIPWRHILYHNMIEVTEIILEHSPQLMTKDTLLNVFKYGTLKSLKVILKYTYPLLSEIEPQEIQWRHIMYHDMIEVIDIVKKHSPQLITKDTLLATFHCRRQDSSEAILTYNSSLLSNLNLEEIPLSDIVIHDSSKVIEALLKHSSQLITKDTLLTAFKSCSFNSLKAILTCKSSLLCEIKPQEIQWRIIVEHDMIELIEMILNQSPQLLTKNDVLKTFEYASCKLLNAILAYKSPILSEVESREIQWRHVVYHDMVEVIKTVYAHSPRLITKDALLTIFEYGSCELLKDILTKKSSVKLVRKIESQEIQWLNLLRGDKSEAIETVKEYSPELITKDTLLTAIECGNHNSLKVIMTNKSPTLSEIKPQEIQWKHIVYHNMFKVMTTLLEYSPRLMTKDTLLNVFEYGSLKSLKIILKYKSSLLSEIEPQEIQWRHIMYHDMIEVIDIVKKHSPRLITPDTLLTALCCGREKSLQAILTYIPSLLSKLKSQEIPWRHIFLQDMSGVIEIVLNHSPQLITKDTLFIAFQYGSITSLKIIITNRSPLFSEIEPHDVQWSLSINYSVPRKICYIIRYLPHLITKDTLLTLLKHATKESLINILTYKSSCLGEIDPKEIKWNPIWFQNMIVSLLHDFPQFMKKHILLTAFQYASRKSLKAILDNNPPLLSEIEPQEIEWRHIVEQDMINVIESLLKHSPQLITKDIVLIAFQYGRCKFLQAILINKPSLLNDIEPHQIEWNLIVQQDMPYCGINVINTVLIHSPNLITKNTLLRAFRCDSFKSSKTILTNKSSLLYEIEAQEIQWRFILKEDMIDVFYSVLKHPQQLITKAIVLKVFEYGCLESLEAIFMHKSAVVSEIQPQETQWVTFLDYDQSKKFETVLKYSPQLITKNTLLTAFKLGSCKSLKVILLYKCLLLNEIEPEEIPWNHVKQNAREVTETVLKYAPQLMTKDIFLTVFKSFISNPTYKSSLLSKIGPQEIHQWHISEQDMTGVFHSMLEHSPQMITKDILLTMFKYGNLKSLKVILTHKSCLLSEINPDEIQWRHVVEKNMIEVIKKVLQQSPQLITKDTLLTAFQNGRCESVNAIVTAKPSLLREIEPQEIKWKHIAYHGMIEKIEIVLHHLPQLISKETLLAVFEIGSSNLFKAIPDYKLSLLNEIEPHEIQWKHIVNHDMIEKIEIAISHSPKLITMDILLTAFKFGSCKLLKAILKNKSSLLSQVDPNLLKWNQRLYYGISDMTVSVLNHSPHLLTKYNLLKVFEHGSVNLMKTVLEYHTSLPLLNEIESHEIQWDHIMSIDVSTLIKTIRKNSPRLITRDTLLTAFRYGSYESLEAILTDNPSLLSEIEPQEIQDSLNMYSRMSTVIETVLKLEPRLITKDTLLAAFKYGRCENVKAIMTYKSSLLNEIESREIQDSIKKYHGTVPENGIAPHSLSLSLNTSRYSYFFLCLFIFFISFSLFLLLFCKK